MSKIETASKVSLKLTNRINLGKGGALARRAIDPAHKIKTANLHHPQITNLNERIVKNQNVPVIKQKGWKMAFIATIVCSNLCISDIKITIKRYMSQHTFFRVEDVLKTS